MTPGRFGIGYLKGHGAASSLQDSGGMSPCSWLSTACTWLTSRLRKLSGSVAVAEPCLLYCVLCCSAGWVHLLMPWALVLRWILPNSGYSMILSSKIISWTNFICPLGGSCAKALEILQQLCAVLHQSVGWHPYPFPQIYWIDKI